MIKIDKSKNYLVTFAHSLDKTDTIQQAVTGKAYFRLRNMLRNLGYEAKEVEEIE